MPDRFELTAEAKYCLLLEISQKLRDTLDLEVILNHLLDTIQTFLDYDAAGIFVLNRAIVQPPFQRPSELIAGIVRRGFDPDRRSSDDPMLTSGKGIIGHVIQSGECVVVPDVRDDARYVVGRHRTLSEIAVPILRDEHPIGALNIESDRLAAFDARDVEILRFFADAASISIEKAMLHRQLLEKERLERQLKTASEVQTSLLPAAPPKIPGYEIAGLCLPTYEIGGDYYDYLSLPGKRLGVVIADVSGDGVPAALVMAAFRANLRSNAHRDLPPAQMALNLNRTLPDFSAHAHFVTVIYAILERETGLFRYATCGHPRPLLFRTSGEVEMLEVAGIALGIFDDVTFPEGETVLAPGDLLLLYTDGVVEIKNPAGEFYSLDGLREIVQKYHALPAAELIQEIIRATSEFSGSAFYRDDFSLVVIRRF
jgi:serine phosphatase RsbU (regulator of sigma subunit)